MSTGEPAGMLLIDGGDLACGELLLTIHRQVRDLTAGTVIGIVTSDPAAAIDIPAWLTLEAGELLV